MSLLNDLQKDMITAMKAKDKVRLTVIRGVRAALQNETIHLGKEELTEDEELSVLSRELKQRKESLLEFEKADRQDLVDKLKSEINILNEYMPEQMSEEDIKQLVADIIESTGASGKKDFGKVMGMIMPKVKGKADGSLVQQIVNKSLNK